MLIAIAVFKYLKGFLLVAAGIAALAVMHKDIQEVLWQAADFLHLNTDNALVQRVMGKLTAMDTRRIELVAIVTLAYAAVFFTEGTGLLLRKLWAEYFTAIVTASFIPFEIHEVFKRVTAVRLISVAINVAVVVYLVYRIRRQSGNANARTKD